MDNLRKNKSLQICGNSQMKRVFFIFSFLICFLSGIAQDEIVVNRFSATEFNKKVFLSWQLAKGSTCKGIEVLRSTDSLQFETVGNIFGVCGSVLEPLNYDFTDDNPITNRKIYYRLLFGNAVESEIVSIEIIDIESGFLLRPNPIYAQGKLYFENNKRQKHELHLTSLDGKIYTMIEADDIFFTINAEELPAGIYSFQVIESSGMQLKARGRLLIAR